MTALSPSVSAQVVVRVVRTLFIFSSIAAGTTHEDTPEILLLLCSICCITWMNVENSGVIRGVAVCAIFSGMTIAPIWETRFETDDDVLVGRFEEVEVVEVLLE